MTSVKHTLTLGLAVEDLRVLAAVRDQAPLHTLRLASLLRLRRQELVTGVGQGGDELRPLCTAAGLYALAPAQVLFRGRHLLAAQQLLARRFARVLALPHSVCLARILNGQRFCGGCADWHARALVSGGFCAEARARYAAPLREEAR